MSKGKGIFCLEGFWFGPKDKTSVAPVLDLLNRTGGIKSQYHRCATKEELYFMLKRWGQKGFQKDFPIIYFAAHGTENTLDFGGNAQITLDEIAELLEGKCERAIFYFGSCSTLNVDKRHIKRFLGRTKGLAAIGYCVEVDWILTAGIELLVLNSLQDYHFDTVGMKNIDSDLKTAFGKITKTIEFRVVLNDRMAFPRKRVLNK